MRVTLDGKTASFKFKVVSENALEGAKVKGSLVYNGKDQKDDIKFVDSEGYDLDMTGVTKSFTTATGDTADLSQAGSYIATLTKDGKSYNVPFTIDTLDLSEASIVVKDKKGAFASTDDLLKAIEINGAALPDATRDLVVTKVTNPSGAAAINGGAGEYTVEFADNVPADQKHGVNVTGTATVKFSILNNVVADENTGSFKYGSKKNVTELTFALVDGESFDASKLALVGSDDVVYSGDAVEVTYYDTVNKKAVDASALANAGEYTATFRIKPVQDFATGAWTGGTKSININIQGAEVQSNEGPRLLLRRRALRRLQVRHLRRHRPVEAPLRRHQAGRQDLRGGQGLHPRGHQVR